MNSQQLLFINILLFAALVLYFVLGRSKHRQRTILDLRKRPDATDAPASAVKTEVLSDVKDELKLTEVQKPPVAQPDIPQKVKSLKGVYFAFNGHEWNAYEVLGCHDGDDIEQITRQYQNLVKTSDVSTLDFYEAAYSAILRSLRR